MDNSAGHSGKYLQDEKSQEKIARDILEGIRKYSMETTRYTPPVVLSADSIPSDTVSHATVKTAHKKGVFTEVEIEAEYPGGYQAWYDYLSKNLKYPDAAVTNEIQGQVMMEFIVKKNGDLTNIHAVSGPEELKRSSIDIIKASGKWIPAKEKGLVVASYKLQPINYKLEQQ